MQQKTGEEGKEERKARNDNKKARRREGMRIGKRVETGKKKRKEGAGEDAKKGRN